MTIRMHQISSSLPIKRTDNHTEDSNADTYKGVSNADRYKGAGCHLITTNGYHPKITNQNRITATAEGSSNPLHHSHAHIISSVLV